MRRIIGVTAILLSIAGTASATDVSTGPVVADFATVYVSLGRLSGQAHELVYDEDDSKLSELVWDLNYAVALNGGLSLQLTDRFFAYGNLSVGLDGDNHMDDYDWIAAPPPAEPDLHSWHGDTALDHYYTLDAGAGVALLDTGSDRLTLLGGFKYTDTKWTAYGGCFNYDGETGCFEKGEKVISYQLSLPAAYAGLGYSGTYDRWAFALEGRAGMTVASPQADDDHWLRELNFLDHLNSEPYVSLMGKASYAVADATSVFVSAAYDKFFEMRGETTYTDTPTGESERSDYDGGGADFTSLNLAMGLDIRF